MKISPRELREAQIPSKAFGFNQDVVDALLERAADTIEGLIEENRQLFEALERLRSEGSSAPMADPFADVEPVVHEQEPEPTKAQPETVAPAATIDESILLAQVSEKEELINKTLLLAQKTADETLKTAKEQAAQLVADAEAKAAELVTQAETNAQSVTGEAQEQAQADLLAAQEQAQNLIAAAEGQANELVSAAQEQADSIHAEERDRFVALVTQLKNERAQLLSDIEILQGFDETNRTKLRGILETDLATLTTRERVDVGAIPELPEIEQIAPPVSASAPDVETVAHSEMKSEPAQSFDEMIAEPEAPEESEVVEDEILEAEHDVLISDDIEVESFDDIEEVAPAGSSDQGYRSDDPFAAFVETPVAAAGDDILDAQVVEPATNEVISSGPTGAFDPGSKGKDSGKLDDDDFFASLREAVQDDAPLGPDDEGDDGTKRKGLFKK